MARIRTGNLPPQRKKEAAPKEPTPSKREFKKADHSLAGRYEDEKKKAYIVRVEQCKHKDGTDEWIEWCPDLGPFKSRLFMPLDEEILRKRIEAGELKRIA